MTYVKILMKIRGIICWFLTTFHLTANERIERRINKIMKKIAKISAKSFAYKYVFDNVFRGDNVFMIGRNVVQAIENKRLDKKIISDVLRMTNGSDYYNNIYNCLEWLYECQEGYDGKWRYIGHIFDDPNHKPNIIDLIVKNLEKLGLNARPYQQYKDYNNENKKFFDSIIIEGEIK